MNILYLTTEDIGSSRISGKVHFWAIVGELEKLGHEVTIIAPDFANSAHRSNETSSNIIRLRVPWKTAIGLLYFECQLLLKVLPICRRVGPDCLLVRGGGPGWLMGIIFLAFRALRCAVVLECNGIVWREYQLRGKPWWQIANVYVSACQQAMTCNYIVGVTESITRSYCAIGRRASHECTTIPNGTDPDRLCFTASDRRRARDRLGFGEHALVAGYVGAFSPWHNIPSMIGAARIISNNEYRDISIVMIGDGEMYDWAKERQQTDHIAGLRLTGRIIDEADLRAWLACFDVGLCINVPLPIDGSPLKLFEYLALGVPVVAAGFEQIKRHCLEEHVGIWLDPGNDRQIVDALLQIHAHRHKWDQVGHRNRQLVQERYTWRHAATRLERCSEENHGAAARSDVRAVAGPGDFNRCRVRV